MKAVLAFLLLAVLSVCSGLRAKPLQPIQLKPYEIEQFMVGFLIGVEIEFAGNLTECIADAGVTLDDFDTGFQDIDQGFKSWSVSDIEQGLIAFGAGVQEVSIVLEVCNVTGIVDDIKAIAEELQSGTSGLVKVIIKEGINIFHNEKNLSKDFKTAVSAWKAGDYKSSGQATGNIIGILLAD
eukprot:TRINITY_DN4060_c0_g1_i2.p1 TRINITY_DN4060_c0_g1~~TRINITY_DN4060_c0_g1_i2.p1  ORF type:complete len:182 (+),score=43.15 TRINITY_DN4060_c0_g1_i2:184-729(+)